MSRPRTPRLIVGAIAIAVLAAGAFLFHGRMFAWVSNLTANTLSVCSGAFSRASILGRTSLGRIDLARTVTDLQDENARLRVQVLSNEETVRELAFYRELSGIQERIGTPHLTAGIFSYMRAGGVRQAVLNRGRDDGVVIGDIVTTSQGAFVGIVERADAHTAVVRTLGDIALEVTGRVAGSDVAGLVRTDSSGAVVLDLVQKDESIIEGATIVTSGDDRSPAGLVIGTVRSVDTDAATLFKIVRLTPAVNGSVRGQVILLRP